jgi:transcriptional regulator with XRE-family HTH domain
MPVTAAKNEVKKGKSLERQMPTTPVQGSRLREIRNNRNTTQEELAEQSKVSVKTIKNIERTGSGTYSLRRDLAEKLADALKLGPSDKAFGILEGAEPFAPRPQPASDEVEYEINCELMRMRYGVDKEWLQHYSPLMFAVLAEQFLEHQQEKLAEMENALLSILDTSVSISADDFKNLFELGLRVAGSKRVELADVMRPVSTPRLDLLEFILEGSNYPVAGAQMPAILWYIRTLTADLYSQAQMGREDVDQFWTSDFRVNLNFGPHPIGLETIASASTLEELVGGDFEAGDCGPNDDAAYDALCALSTGIVRIQDIPETLLGPEKAAERQAWLLKALKESRDKDLQEAETNGWFI